jgi:hypothetical protein
MGVCLGYSTTQPVSPEVRTSIEAEANQASPPHGWWTEPLAFYGSTRGDECMRGRTKIFLIGYSTDAGGYVEVAGEEDCLMAYRDSCFITERLADWSRRHGVTWEVSCAGQPIGLIDNGRCDQQLVSYLEGWKDLFPWPSSFEDRVKEISEKYASRW